MGHFTAYHVSRGVRSESPVTGIDTDTDTDIGIDGAWTPHLIYDGEGAPLRVPGTWIRDGC